MTASGAGTAFSLQTFLQKFVHPLKPQLGIHRATPTYRYIVTLIHLEVITDLLALMLDSPRLQTSMGYACAAVI